MSSEELIFLLFVKENTVSPAKLTAIFKVIYKATTHCRISRKFICVLFIRIKNAPQILKIRVICVVEYIKARGKAVHVGAFG